MDSFWFCVLAVFFVVFFLFIAVLHWLHGSRRGEADSFNTAHGVSLVLILAI